MISLQNVGILFGIVIGLSSLALGIANFCHLRRFAAPKLRVALKLAMPGPMDEMITQTYPHSRFEQDVEILKTYACIEITNLGTRSQTIQEVGFIDPNGVRTHWRNVDSTDPVQDFPLVLQPDETISVYQRIFANQSTEVQKVAYALTDCNEER